MTGDEMTDARKRNEHRSWTTASQLAEMGYCERKLVFTHSVGHRTSIDRHCAQRTGTAEHDAFLQAAFREQPAVASSKRPPGSAHFERLRSFHARFLNLVRRFLSILPGGKNDE